MDLETVFLKLLDVGVKSMIVFFPLVSLHILLSTLSLEYKIPKGICLITAIIALKKLILNNHSHDHQIK